MKDLMVDIETLGTGRDAAIASIGACYFHPLTGEIGDTFHEKVSFSPSMGKVDPGTVEWWFGQSQEARDALMSGERSPLVNVLADFANFTRAFKVTGFWSNGPTFDEMIIRDAFTRLDKFFPVSFRASRCCRTKFADGDEFGVPRLPFEGVKHDALADAVNQARNVANINRFIRGRVLS